MTRSHTNVVSRAERAVDWAETLTFSGLAVVIMAVSAAMLPLLAVRNLSGVVWQGARRSLASARARETGKRPPSAIDDAVPADGRVDAARLAPSGKSAA